MKKRAKKQSQTTELLTINAIAERTGSDRRTVKKRLAGVQPVKVVHGLRLFSLSAFRDALERSKATGEEKEQLEIRRLLAQCQRLEYENATERAKYISREELDTTIRHLADGMKAVLLANEDEWPPKLAGLSAPAIKVQLRILTDSFCEKMRALAVSYRTEPTEKVKTA